MVSTRSSKTKRDTVDNPEIEKERPAKKPKVKSVKKMAEADASSGDGPVYFWRESHPELGYLSQWYYCPFQNPEDPSKTYKTAEHYMMHQKALLFGDEKVALEILKASHPRGVKALGRKVKNFDDKKWNENRERIVYEGNIYKFTNAITEQGFQKGTSAKNNLPPIDGSLKEMLLATGDREIVEASPFDAIWGIGFKAADAEAAKESWGLNLLGKELMRVRKYLKEGEKKQD